MLNASNKKISVSERAGEDGIMLPERRFTSEYTFCMGTVACVETWIW